MALLLSFLYVLLERVMLSPFQVNIKTVILGLSQVKHYLKQLEAKMLISLLFPDSTGDGYCPERVLLPMSLVVTLLIAASQENEEDGVLTLGGDAIKGASSERIQKRDLEEEPWCPVEK